VEGVCLVGLSGREEKVERGREKRRDKVREKVLTQRTQRGAEFAEKAQSDR
jgi:hypothetical protein